jgi:hypothetical protein
MANRVEFTDKNGKTKNMDRPLAMRLQARKQGKITKELRVGNKNSAKKIAELEDALLNSEIKNEELTKQIEKLKAKPKVEKPTPNKADKEASNKVNK